MSRRSCSQQRNKNPEQRLHPEQFTASSPLFRIEHRSDVIPVGRDLIEYFRALSDQQQRFRVSTLNISRLVLREQAVNWLTFVILDDTHVLNRFNASLYYIRLSFSCRSCTECDLCYVCEFSAQAIRFLRHLSSDWQYYNRNSLPRNFGPDIRNLIAEFTGIPHVVDRVQSIINSTIYLLDRGFAPEIRFEITVQVLVHWIDAIQHRTLIPFVDPNFDHHGGGHGGSHSATRVVPVARQPSIIRHFSGFVPSTTDNQYRRPAIDFSETFNITDEDIDYSDQFPTVYRLPGDPDSEEENSRTSDSEEMEDAENSDSEEREFSENTYSTSDSEN
jgi:hypothetical protein